MQKDKFARKITEKIYQIDNNKGYWYDNKINTREKIFKIRYAELIAN